VVRGLAEVGAADRLLAGGKAAALGELARAGLPVPGGYVVTTAAFGRAMAALDPSDGLVRSVQDLPAGDVEGIARVAADVRARIRASPPPPEVASQVLGAYEELGATAARVSLRTIARAELTDDCGCGAFRKARPAAYRVNAQAGGQAT